MKETGIGQSPDVVLDGSTIKERGVFSEGGAPQILADYWLEKSDASPVVGPQWSQFELMDIYAIAPRVVIKDVINGGAEFRNRYWGTHITDAFHLDATGKITGEYLSAGFAKQGLDLLRMVIQEIRPVRVWGRAEFFSQADHKTFEAAFVPLFGADGKATQVASAFRFEFTDV